MPWLVGTFVRYFLGPLVTGLALLLRTRFGAWIVLAMIWMGVGFTTFNLAIEPMMAQLESFAQGTASGIYGEVAIQTLGTLNFDIAGTMYFSALLAKQAVGAARLFFVKT